MPIHPSDEGISAKSRTPITAVNATSSLCRMIDWAKLARLNAAISAILPRICVTAVAAQYAKKGSESCGQPYHHTRKHISGNNSGKLNAKRDQLLSAGEIFPARLWANALRAVCRQPASSAISTHIISTRDEIHTVGVRLAGHRLRQC